MPTENRLAALRTRAYQLADTGRYRDWDNLSAALNAEGAPLDLLQRLGDDGVFRIMIASRLKRERRR
jgi:hypothetical protein